MPLCTPQAIRVLAVSAVARWLTASSSTAAQAGLLVCSDISLHLCSSVVKPYLHHTYSVVRHAQSRCWSAFVRCWGFPTQ